MQGLALFPVQTDWKKNLLFVLYSNLQSLPDQCTSKKQKRMVHLMDAASWTFILVMSSICGIACTVISFRKGYRGSRVMGWFAAGLVFSIFGLIAVILAPHGSEEPLS
jgi:nicotinamide riboside transporter PnuC